MTKIEDYAFLSDTQTCALVSSAGSVDWLCFPRFDSGACFAALLGDEKNGRWRFQPVEKITATRRRYRGDTLILETEIETEGGVARLIDFMPPRGRAPDIVRIVEGVRGTVSMKMELTIRFDYGHIVPWVRQRNDGLEAIAGPDALILRTPVETWGEDMHTVAEFTVGEGERVPFVLTWFLSHQEAPPAVHAEHALQETETYWREWSNECCSQGPWREAVVRSLITLKGLTYEPTGGIVAAATTSLPEEIGGVRNWDYRYCWLRDATFTLRGVDGRRISRRGAGLARMAPARHRWQARADADHVRSLRRATPDGVRIAMAGRLRKIAAGASRKPGLRSIPTRRLWRGARLDVSRALCRDQNERDGLAVASGLDPRARIKMGAAGLRHLGSAGRAATFHPLEDDGLGGVRSRGQDRGGQRILQAGKSGTAGARFAIASMRRSARAASTKASRRSPRSMAPTHSTPACS